jgi:chromosome segregation ATPase
MSRSLIERRLAELGDRLRVVRDELAVADEQLDQFNDTAEDTRLRALVSETPLADREHREAQRHADAMARHRTDLHTQIEQLMRQQDDLLDRLMAEMR